MTETKNIAIFASGEGTNFSALMESFKKNHLPIKVSVLVCDHSKAHVLKRAEKESVPTFVINFSKYPNKAAAEKVILKELQDRGVEFIILSGYMRIIGPTLLSVYPNKIINIHPALLPSFPGRTGIDDAWNYGVKVTGVTVHWVDSGIDSGKIIAQDPVRRLPDDTRDSLEAKIHQTEHKLYPRVVKELLDKGEI